MDAGLQLDLDIEVEFEAELEPVLCHDIGLLAATGIDALGLAEVLLRRRTTHGDFAAPSELSSSAPLAFHVIGSYGWILTLRVRRSRGRSWILTEA